MSSRISEKPISRSVAHLFRLWSMVMRSWVTTSLWFHYVFLCGFFLDFHVRTFKCQRIDQKTLILLRWRHGSWTLDEKYSLKIGEISALSWWSKLIQNAPFAVKLFKIFGGNPPIQPHSHPHQKQQNRRPPTPGPARADLVGGTGVGSPPPLFQSGSPPPFFWRNNSHKIEFYH